MRANRFVLSASENKVESMLAQRLRKWRESMQSIAQKPKGEGMNAGMSAREAYHRDVGAFVPPEVENCCGRSCCPPILSLGEELLQVPLEDDEVESNRALAILASAELPQAEKRLELVEELLEQIDLQRSRILKDRDRVMEKVALLREVAKLATVS